jgi:hypothetical protein
VAETDGTPRYRKSKPPKSGNAGARNSKPGGKSKKRAALRETLPSGSTLDPSAPSPAAIPAVVSTPDLANSAVKTTMPTVIRTQGQGARDAKNDALAETHADMRGTNARGTAPLAGGKPGPQPGPQSRTIRSALGSTLRMELKVHKGEGGAEPRIQLNTTAPLGNAGRSEPAHGEAGLGDSRDQHRRSRKPTEPGFAPAFPDPSAGPGLFSTNRLDVTEADEEPSMPAAARRSSDFGHNTLPSSRAPSVTGPGASGDRPRRPRRPGERTLIMTRRPKKSGKRDWVFVVLLVAALGLTASMFLSQQAPAEEVVDANAYDEAQPQDEAQDPFAPTTLRPWDAQKAQKNAQSDTNAATAREPAPPANSVQATELRSQPPGAEVIAGNAVVGSTPVRVARGTTDMVYILRLAGHESKIVRVGPNSPPAIMVELGTLVPPTPAAPAAPAADDEPAAPSGRF